MAGPANYEEKKSVENRYNRKASAGSEESTGRQKLHPCTPQCSVHVLLPIRFLEPQTRQPPNAAQDSTRPEPDKVDVVLFDPCGPRDRKLFQRKRVKGMAERNSGLAGTDVQGSGDGRRNDEEECGRL